MTSHKDCHNKCGIPLLSFVGKVYNVILEKIMRAIADLLPDENQSGCCPKRGYQDQIFSLIQRSSVKVEIIYMYVS